MVKMDRNGVGVVVYDRNDTELNLFRKRVFKVGGTTRVTEGFIEKGEL